MHQGTVKGSDPGQKATQNKGASPVAHDMSAGHEPLLARITQLQKQVERLQRERDDMESFADAVAHDLRSPLSAIDGFSTLLLESLEPLADPCAEQARHLAARVRAGAEQMGELIEGLQALSQLSRSPLQWGQVDLSALAEQVLSRLRQQHPQPPVHARVQPMLRAAGDRRLLRQLLENLLGNARKFSSCNAQVQIEFGQLPTIGAVTPAGWGGAFYVRDQGAGFDMAQSGRLFRPYQRLHSSDQFEGLGLGLATVQRIVARHGGRVHAQSAPGQGATVYFTLGGIDAPNPIPNQRP